MDDVKITEEARLSKLEAEVGHVVSSINVLSSTVQKGFEETRSMFGDVHERISEHERTSERDHRVNPSLIVSIVVASLAVGGVFVSFVNMTANSIRGIHHNDVEWREKIESMRYDHLREIIKIHEDKENGK